MRLPAGPGSGEQVAAGQDVQCGGDPVAGTGRVTSLPVTVSARRKPERIWSGSLFNIPTTAYRPSSETPWTVNPPVGVSSRCAVRRMTVPSAARAPTMSPSFLGQVLVTGEEVRRAQQRVRPGPEARVERIGG